jgi:hypothetical protein
MRAVAGTNASDGLSDDVFGFFLRNRVAGAIHFSEILPQLVRDLQFPLMWNGSRLERADADGFAFRYAASQKGFDKGFLVGRKVAGIADHNLGPPFIIPDGKSKTAKGTDSADLSAGTE